MSFQELGLSQNLLKAIKDCGYETPTPIQAKAIPHILMARDVVGLAQTGTGKTASFTLPMIEILSGGRAKARMPRSLVLSPTRELAAQIAENFDTYGRYSGLSHALLVGGVSMDEQIKKLDRGVDVLIATPGRLLDLFQRGRILLSDIKVLVIDEADRMLDMGFIPDIERIVCVIPAIRQTLLFSATMPPAIKKLTEQFLSNPREVSVTPAASTGITVEQCLIPLRKGAEKTSALLALLKSEQPDTAFIFCNRKRDIEGLCRTLNSKNWNAKALHGDMNQSHRTETLDLLRAGKVRILVCSDVAGRGIDVDHVTHVINYDVPFNADDYVHRIGRTGRAGRKGKAFTFAVRGADDKFVTAIEESIKKPIPVGNALSDEKKEEEESSGEAGSRRRRRSSPPPKSDVKSDTKPTPNAAHKRSEKDQGMEGNVVGFGNDIPYFMK